MADTFYGPWHVRVFWMDPLFPDRITINGSDAGASFVLPSQEPNGIEVTGSEWSIAVEHMSLTELENPPLPPVEVENWTPRKMKRYTRFDPADGLLVQLDTVDLPYLSLLLISRDRSINPDRQNNPFDFTLPD